MAKSKNFEENEYPEYDDNLVNSIIKKHKRLLEAVGRL